MTEVISLSSKIDDIQTTKDNKEEIEIGKENDKQFSTLALDSLPLSTRAGGVYIPPFKMEKIMEEIRQKSDTQSIEYQKVMWELLRKSINGIINKVNISNIQNVIYELFNENLLRGKGLFVRSVMKAQMTSPNFTHVYAALISVINSKLPDIGNLIIRRYIIQFQKAYKRNNKIVCNATTRMIAHLINQQVNENVLAFEILVLFLDNTTEDSIELSCEFMIECGQFLSDSNSTLTNSIFERFRAILQEGKVEKRIQYIIENLFLIRKVNYKDHPAVIPDLDLVRDEDKIIHTLSLDNEDIKAEDELDIFHYDDNYDQNENVWQSFKIEILGNEGADDNNQLVPVESNEDYLNNNEDNGNQEDKEEEEEIDYNTKIIDLNESDLIKLRKVIYLTIISSVDFQECCHKLLKLNMKEGQEMELVNMIIECCIQERAYLRFYGLLAERLCLLKEVFKQNFEVQFENQYIKVHRLETNKLRNLSKLFAHLLATNAFSWSVLKIIKLTEEDTTASSRIFCKIVFQELAEFMGLEKLNDKLQEHVHDDYSGLFCRDNPKNTKFCINFFTSIGLGALTQDLRELLVNAEKMIEEHNNQQIIIHQGKEDDSMGDDSSESGSGSDSGSESDSDSESDSERKSESENKAQKIKEKQKIKSDDKEIKKVIKNDSIERKEKEKLNKEEDNVASSKIKMNKIQSIINKPLSIHTTNYHHSSSNKYSSKDEKADYRHERKHRSRSRSRSRSRDSNKRNHRKSDKSRSSSSRSDHNIKRHK